MRSRVAAVALLAVPFVALPFMRANDDVGGGFAFETTTRGRIETSIEATGTVEAVETVDVGSEVSGLIAKVFVNFNDSVAAGQPLAELDRAGFKARVDEARAALKVEKALADVQRLALRRAEIAIATAQDERKMAQAQANAAQARRDEAERAAAEAAVGADGGCDRSGGGPSERFRDRARRSARSPRSGRNEDATRSK